MYAEDHAKSGTKKDCFIYVAVNAYWEDCYYELPQIPGHMDWYLRLNSYGECYGSGKEKKIDDQNGFMLGQRACAVLIARQR